ncbi:MAG: GNAT family N-acetyltransferase [Mycoplasmatales bacterium]
MKNKFIIANVQDLVKIMEIIEAAKLRMQAEKLVQWQDDYPNQIIILEDIKKKQLYKYEIAGQIAGICVINSDFYEQYPPYGLPAKGQVIHRLVVAPNFLRQGIGTTLFQASEKLIKEQGYEYILVDTNTLNNKMCKLIEKNEYKALGEFEFIPNLPNWILYQKKLKD